MWYFPGVNAFIILTILENKEGGSKWIIAFISDELYELFYLCAKIELFLFSYFLFIIMFLPKSALHLIAFFNLPPFQQRLLWILLSCLGPLSSIAQTPGMSTYRDTFCSTQTIFIGNQLFDPSNPTGTVTLPGAAASGGDSIIQVQLLFRQPIVTNINAPLCVGDTLWVNGTAYHAGFYLGTELVDGGAVNGCDSIINIALTVSGGIRDYNAVLCEGDTLYINGTAYHAFNTQGDEHIPNSSGCDSILRIRLDLRPAPFSSVRDTLCPDEFRIVNGVRYDRANRFGLEIMEGASYTGCDSLVDIGLTYRETWIYIGEDKTIYQGDTLCITPLFANTPTTITWLTDPPCPAPDCVGDCKIPLASFQYGLQVVDSFGCVLTSQVTIGVSKDNRVYLPTVFSPEGESPNNYYYISGDNGVVNILKFVIADRWGEILYERKNIPPGESTEGWDGMYRGKLADIGVYVCFVELERPDGSRFVKTGSFSLVK